MPNLVAEQAVKRGQRRMLVGRYSFKPDDGSIFHTTFTCKSENGSWQWQMDSEKGGERKPFARAT